MDRQPSFSNKPRKTKRSSTRLATCGTMLIAAALLAGCGTASKVSVYSACDVFTDSLRDVHATTPAGEDRISKHFETGIGAGCWKR